MAELILTSILILYALSAFGIWVSPLLEDNPILRLLAILFAPLTITIVLSNTIGRWYEGL